LLVDEGRVEEQLERARLEDAIGVHHQQQRRAAARGVGIVAAAEAHVLARMANLDAREGGARFELGTQRFHRRALGAVVVDEEVQARTAGRLGEAREQLAQERQVRLVGDDADVSFAHGRASRGCA
jgi:hypothetical protein